MNNKPQTKKPKGKIAINRDRCKGCGYCIITCPKKLIVVDTEFNAAGYFPALYLDGDCTGCAQCSIICPDIAITVWREE
jgi:2-oxoglutarate ferredoxin oxidoreductase subunit delta